VTSIRTWLQGKKTYLTALIGILSATALWADGQITGTGMLTAAWVAIQTCFLRAGSANDASKNV
jgi:hypothetical protein